MYKKKYAGTQAAGAYKALPLGSLLARMAAKLPPEEKKVKPPKKDGRRRNIYNLTPEQIAKLQSPQRLRRGELKALAEEYGISYRYATGVRMNWRNVP